MKCIKSIMSSCKSAQERVAALFIIVLAGSLLPVVLCSNAGWMAGVMSATAEIVLLDFIFGTINYTESKLCDDVE